MWPFTQLDDIQSTLRAIRATQAHHTTALHGLIERTRNMATQDQVDALAAQVDAFESGLTSALDGIQGDLDALKAAHPEVDLSALEGKVAALADLGQRAAGIDAETPTA